MKREIAICLLALTNVSMSLSAATVDKEVEVTRAYVPDVPQATKIHLTPDMSDNGYIKPDIDYSITPVSIKTEFTNDVFKPVVVNLEEYEPSQRYYTKLGVGAPWQSVVDLYATPIKSTRGYVMGYFNQQGEFAKREDLYGDKQSGAENHMRLGLAAGRYMSDRTLEGSINYNNDRWSRYATDAVTDDKPLYQSVDFRGKFGDNFGDLSRWNFAIDGDAEHFWSRSKLESNSFGLGGLLGRELFGGSVIMGGGYGYISGDGGYGNSTVDVAAKYIYDSGFMRLKIGLSYYFDKVSCDYYSVSSTALPSGVSWLTNDSNSDSYISPDVELSYQLNRDKMILYFRTDGELNHHDFASLTEINPYVAPGLFATQNSFERSVDLGVKGSIASGRVGYNIYGQYTSEKNHLYWALQLTNLSSGREDNEFVANYSTQQSYSINADLEYVPVSNLLIATAFKAATYHNNSGQVWEDGESTIEWQMEAKYRKGAWRFGVETELLSSRECSVTYDGTRSSYVDKIPTTFALGLSADYSLRNSMVLFAKVDNILNQDLYKWVGYREYGIGAMVGVKMEF